MRKVVLDVNVIVSGITYSNSVPGALVQLGVDGFFELILSEHILRGVERAWSKPYFRQRFGEDTLALALGHVRHRSRIIVPDPFVTGVALDDEDDQVIGTAIAGRADYLVTGDQGLLRLSLFRDVAIMSPRDFLDLLTEN